MPSLGNLFVTIGAKTDGLDSSAKKSEKTLGSLNRAMMAIVSSGALLGGAAVTAGAGIIAGLVNSGRIAIDTEAKLAQALDGTIGGLRAMVEAADDAGVSQEELSGALVKLNFNLGEAQKGSGAAYDALNRLGLSAEELSKMDIDQRMIVISDRIKELGLSSSQAASELRDLGIRNENLANLMRQGGDAIRAQAQEVRDLGLNLSMVDAAQVEAANDALGIFGDVLKGIQDRLTVAVAPYITVISEKFRQAALDSGGFKSAIEDAIKGIITSFGKLGNVIQGLRVVFKGLELVGVGFGAAFISVIEMVASAVTFFVDTTLTKNVNRAIAVLNMLPNVDIATVDPFSNSAFMNGLHEFGDSARNHVSSVRSELHELAMQKLPSDNINQFLKEVADASKKTAQETVAARAAITGGGGGDYDMTGGKGGKDAADAAAKEAERLAQQQASELESIKNRYITEEQLLAEHRETMAIIGEEWDASKFETEAQWRSVREQAEADHLQKMQDLNRSAYDGIAGIVSSRWGKMAASTATSIKSIIGTMASGSKKAFEVSKAWALADAAISTYQGIAAGLKLGWPMAIPAVAYAAATGFAQISQIRNQSYGSAGGAAASGGGAPAAAPNPVGVGGSTGGGGNQREMGVMTVQGLDPTSMFSGRQITGWLDEAMANGYMLRAG